MEQDENFDFLEYAYVIWRRKWLFLIVSALVLAIASIVIAKLPVIYRSTATVLVERQEIPEQWVNSTVTSDAEDRIQAIGQRVLTTENIVRIIDQFNLYPNLRDKFTRSELVARARGKFLIENVPRPAARNRTTGARNIGTAAFTVSFSDSSAKIARDVTNDIVTLYLDENRKTRTQSATDTRRFLEVEADRIERQLTDIETKISKFKEINMGVLPEQQDLNIQAYERVEQEISEINTTLISLEERKIVLESSIASARRVLIAANRDNQNVEDIDPARTRLDELRSEFVNLQTRYSSSHPDLIRLQREIGLLETQLESGSRLESSTQNSAIASSYQDDTAIIQLTSDLRSAISEGKSLRKRKAELMVKLDDLEARINKTPEVELEYRSLNRDYENVQEKYNDIRSKQNSARVSESLEEEQKGERFILIETPEVAKRPISPDYPKMFIVAVGATFLSGLGAVFGLEFLDGTIRNVRSVESLTGVPVFATVGYIDNTRDHQSHQIKKIISIALLTLVILGSLYLIKFYHSEAAELNLRTLLEDARSTISDITL